MNKLLLKGLVLVVGATWALALIARGVKLPDDFWVAYPVAVSACAIAVFIFDTWAWRWPIITLTHKTPVLRGTWAGHFQRDLSSGQSAEGPSSQVFLAVTQTYSTIHVRMFTPQSSSLSLSCGVAAEKDGRVGVAWVYQNEPEYLERGASEIHNGAAKVRVEGSPPTHMRGHYWTDRKPERTAGVLEFSFLSRAVIQGFEQGGALAGSLRATK